MGDLIDGTAIAAQIRAELKEKVKELQDTFGVTPGLAVILVGERRDSATYVRSKKKACAEIGINSSGFDYPADVSEEELLAKIDELNNGMPLCLNRFATFSLILIIYLFWFVYFYALLLSLVCIFPPFLSISPFFH
jgi:hypothetical protein